MNLTIPRLNMTIKVGTLRIWRSCAQMNIYNVCKRDVYVRAHLSRPNQHLLALGKSSAVKCSLGICFVQSTPLYGIEKKYYKTVP